MSFATLMQIVKEDWQAHDRDWTRAGFRALAFYRFGVWRMQIRSKWLRAPCSVLYRLLYRHARNVYGIELPYCAQIGRRVVFEHQHGIVVHGRSQIGDDSIIRQGVTIGNRYQNRDSDAPVLGCRVNVGAGAKILGHIVIGDDVIIGANAVVLTDIPAKATATGVPARIMMARNSKDAHLATLS